MKKFYWTKKQAYLAGIKDAEAKISENLPDIVANAVEKAMAENGIPHLEGDEIAVRFSNLDEYLDALAKEELVDFVCSEANAKRYFSGEVLNEDLQKIRISLLYDYMNQIKGEKNDDSRI